MNVQRHRALPVNPLVVFLVLTQLVFVACASTAQTLDLWIVDWQPTTQELFESQLIPAFKDRHPGVDVQVTWSTWNVHRDRLTTAIAAGVGPDVFQVGGADTGWIASSRLAQPITRYFESWEQRQAVPPGILESITRDGEIWSIPYLAAPRTLIYLRDTFEIAGLDSDTPPSTWEDVTDVVRKLTKREGDHLARAGLPLALSGTNVFETWSPMLQPAGGSVAAEDLTPAFVSDAGTESLAFYRDLVMIQELHVYGAAGLDFWNNEIGMLISNSGTITEGLDAGLITMDDVVIAPPPLRKKRTATVFTDPLAVSSTSNQPDLAWELIAFLTEPENLAAYNETQGFVPPLTSALQTEYVRTSPLVQAFGAILQYAHAIPPLGDYFEIRTAISEDLALAVNGKIPVQTALEQAAAKWRAIRSD